MMDEVIYTSPRSWGRQARDKHQHLSRQGSFRLDGLRNVGKSLEKFLSFGAINDRLLYPYSREHAAWRPFSSFNLIIPYLWCLPTRTVDTTLCLVKWSAWILWLSGLLFRPFHWSSFYKIYTSRYAWWLHHLTPRCTPEQSYIAQCRSRRSWLRYRERHYRTSSKGFAVLPESLTRTPLPLLHPREPGWVCCTQSFEHSVLPSSKRRTSRWSSYWWREEGIWLATIGPTQSFWRRSWKRLQV